MFWNMELSDFKYGKSLWVNSYQSIQQIQGWSMVCFCGSKYQNQTNLALTAQGDEERQLGIPVSPMCELGAPEFLAATTVGCITAVGV